MLTNHSRDSWQRQVKPCTVEMQLDLPRGRGDLLFLPGPASCKWGRPALSLLSCQSPVETLPASDRLGYYKHLASWYTQARFSGEQISVKKKEGFSTVCSHLSFLFSAFSQHALCHAHCQSLWGGRNDQAGAVGCTVRGTLVRQQRDPNAGFYSNPSTSLNPPPLRAQSAHPRNGGSREACWTKHRFRRLVFLSHRRERAVYLGRESR